MRHIIVDQATKRMRINIGKIPIPDLNKDEILLKVSSFGINRADLLQRKGKYPPPNGVTDVIGLECSGFIVNDLSHINQINSNIGSSITINNPLPYNKSKPVMALLSGGGYAEYVVVNKNHIVDVPNNLNLISAGGIMEVYITAFQLLNYIVRDNNLYQESNILIHGCASGVGTALVQLVNKLYKANAYGVCSTNEKLEYMKKLGLKDGVLRTDENYHLKLSNMIGNKEYEGILDHVGKAEYSNNINLIKKDGSIVTYGMISGGKIENIDLSKLLTKRVNIHYSTLRNRSDQYKTDLINKFWKEVLPLFIDESIREVIYKKLVFSEENLNYSHEILERNENIGKVVVYF